MLKRVKTALTAYVDLLCRPLFKRYLTDVATKKDLDNLYSQLSSLLSINQMLGPNASVGTLRGWALSPDAMLAILREIRQRNACRIIEFGGGESTLALAAYMQQAPARGSIKTIEHDNDFANDLQARLNAAGLEHFVEIIKVPLREYPAARQFGPFLSYDLARIDYDFDVAIIDGPIVASFGEATRLVPAKWCLDRLTDNNAIYLDDAKREAERKVIEEIKSVSPNLTFKELLTEKGLIKVSQ
jgi:hypothetical protein